MVKYGGKKHFIASGTRWDPPKILRPLQPFNNPSLIIEPNELIFFFSNFPIYYVCVLFKSRWEKIFRKKYILGGLWGKIYHFLVSSRPGRDETTFKASTVYNPSVWPKCYEILGVTQARWRNTLENFELKKIYVLGGIWKKTQFNVGLIASGTRWDPPKL